MDLSTLITTWATVLMLIIMLIKYFEEFELELDKDIASILGTFPNRPISDIIKTSGKLFLRLFDCLYETNPEKNFYLWFWIFFSTIFTIIFALNFQLENKIVPPLEKLLLLSIILPTLVILYMRIFNFGEIMYKKVDFIVLFGIFSGIGQVLLIFVIIISIYFDLNKFFSVQMTSDQIKSILGMFFLGSSLLIFFIYFSFEKFRFLTKISPIRAILSSLLAILLVALLSTLFNEKIFQSFISDFNKIGITLIAYIFLNIFADSISLWETNIILRSAIKGSTLKLSSLLILDIILSALIFLVIPWSTGNLNIFFEAIKFQGENPWLGILFWSTFFTSIIFYIFVLSTCMLIALQGISRYYIRLDGVLPIMDKPLKSLGAVAMFLITVVFIIISIIK